MMHMLTPMTVSYLPKCIRPIVRSKKDKALRTHACCGEHSPWICLGLVNPRRTTSMAPVCRQNRVVKTERIDDAMSNVAESMGGRYTEQHGTERNPPPPPLYLWSNTYPNNFTVRI